MSSLLPINSTKLERDMEATLSRVSDVPVNIASLWNPDTCPAVFLPWLAWAMSVDVWFDSWTDAQKRNAIKASFATHAAKGTPVSIEQALGVLEVEPRVVEWFEYAGSPYMFDLDVDIQLNPLTDALHAQVMEILTAYKNARSHLDSVRYFRASSGPIYTGGKGLISDVITLSQVGVSE